MPVVATELHVDNVSAKETKLKLTFRFPMVQVADKRLSGIR